MASLSPAFVAPSSHGVLLSSTDLSGAGSRTTWRGEAASLCRAPSRLPERCLGLVMLAKGRRKWKRKATRVRRYETNTWPAKDSCEVNFDEALSSIQQRSVALILNRNAKGVNKKVESKLQGIVGPARTFACCSEEDAEHALRKVMDDCECKVVVCGGGDGTVTSLLNMMAKLREEAVSNERELKSSPTMCVLRLGTGNALAYLTGAQKNYAKDLSDLVDHVEEEEVPEIPTSTICLTAEGLPSDSPDKMHCFFAGLGYDARMLQDYMWLRDKTKENRFLSKMLHNPLGYLVALALRTLPATMRGEHVFHVKVTNLGEDAYSMDPRRGDWAFECKKGQVIYEGETGIVSVGTVPYYGGGFRLFPFAGVRPGYAHLRLSHIHPAAATFNIRPLWQGTYRDYKHVHDFLVKDVMVEVDQPTPLHHSGDFMGTASKVRFQVTSDGSTRLVDFFED
ncbi:DAGKc domain-containing protein [Durusdinium trenchii]